MHSKKISISYIAILAVFCLVIAGAIQDLESSSESEFSLEMVEAGARAKVAEIFKQSCASSSCHGGKYPKAKLNLEPEMLAAELIGAASVMDESFKLVDTAAPERSYLMMKIRGDKGIKGKRMPIQRASLGTDAENYISLWIYSVHLISRKEGSKKEAGEM